MPMLSSNVVSLLNDLIETCRDGEQGYRQAADGIKDPQLKALFLQYSSQRADFASELQAEVARSGAKPEKSGSVGGAMHRGWINIKAAVTGKDEGAIISECERGEDVAKESYSKAINAALPETVAAMVQRQYAEVKQAHDRIRALELAHQR